jgi:hypothetical protein
MKPSWNTCIFGALKWIPNFPFLARILFAPLRPNGAGLFHPFFMLMLILVSLWLQAGVPLLGVWGPHDDALFLRLATATPWLGEYGNMTLVKGAFFPLLLSWTKALGLPIKLVEHSIYLAASLLAARAIFAVTGNRQIMYASFVMLALNPVSWTVAGIARLTRESIYESLTLGLLAMATLYIIRFQRSRGLGLAIGLLTGCYWLTREEGVWLLPSILVILLLSVSARNIVTWRMNICKLRAATIFLFPPMLGFSIVVGFVNVMNFENYGVFRNNDLRGGPFSQGYGALSRIEANEWKRYVVFPRDARQRAYSVSSAARELEPFLEGDFAKMWVRAGYGYPSPWGCSNEPTACNDEILSPWFIWALRDAVAGAGYYGSASDADAFYTRLAHEINTACDHGEIPCKAYRATLAPIWRGHYAFDALAASGKILKTLVRLNRGHTGIPASSLTSDQATQFREVTHDRLSGLDVVEPTETLPRVFYRLRQEVVQAVASSYAAISTPFFFLSLASYFFVIFAWRRKMPAAASGDSVVFLSALLVAVCSRVGLLGFLEVTSIPSNNLLYLLPVVPIYILFVTVSIGVATLTIYTTFRNRH